MSLFSTDSIDFDQIYLLLKILVPKHEMVYFKYKEKDAFGRKISEIMQNIHDKFCLGDKNLNLETLFASNF